MSEFLYSVALAIAGLLLLVLFVVLELWAIELHIWWGALLCVVGAALAGVLTLRLTAEAIWWWRVR